MPGWQDPPSRQRWVGKLVPRPIINSSQSHNSSQMAPGSWGLDHLLLPCPEESKQLSTH